MLLNTYYRYSHLERISLIELIILKCFKHKKKQQQKKGELQDLTRTQS